MNFVNIIDKKSKGLELTKEEINFFVDGYMDESIPDYQVSSLLMAIKINGFTDAEVVEYARALIDSGETLPLKKDYVDKHSSGGVGDKTSLILLPVLAAMGLKIFKLSGRGLGFTGGTLDKLDSIENFDSNLTIEKMTEIVESIGCSITGQSPKLTPADGKIYALRDITATVDSIPLIAASIISKKIASGAKNILIDLKVGTGAFINNLEEANELARVMKLIASSLDRDLYVLFSNMDQPLGKAAGNKIEVKEAVDFMNGIYSEDIYLLIEKISTELYKKSKGVSLEEAKAKFNEVIEGGIAKEKQIEWFKAQGAEWFEGQLQYNPSFIKEYTANQEGYVSIKDNKIFGNILIELKAGRKQKGDALNLESGIEILVKTGDKVTADTPLFKIYNTEEVSEDIVQAVRDNIIVSDEKVEFNIILGALEW